MISGKNFRTALLLFALISALALMSQNAGATGVGVWNSPPTFVSMSIRDTNNEIAIVINVSDYNGWADIYRVVLTVMDPDGNVVQEVEYKQYPTNTSSVRVDTFEETAGRFLKPKDPDDPYSGSRVRRFSGAGWFEDNTTQEVTFLFRPFSGSYLRVVMEDSKGLVGTHEGPFSARYSAPPVLTDAVTPLAISAVAGSIGAGVAVTNRASSNRMARKLSRMKGGG